jgi:Rrf2 family protein
VKKDMAHPFRMQEATSIALHSMVKIAQAHPEPQQVAVLASEIGVSRNHLAKVLQRLHKAGLVKSKRGPKGGVTLAKEPQQINLLEIYEAIEGKFSPNACLLNKKDCPFKKCIMGNLVGEIGRMFGEFFASYSLADFKSKNNGR